MNEETKKLLQDINTQLFDEFQEKAIEYANSYPDPDGKFYVAETVQKLIDILENDCHFINFNK